MTLFEQQTDWMRRAVIYAAECLVRLPDNAPVDPRIPFSDHVFGWDLLAKAAPRAELQDWLLAALAASERHPDAAAGFSILAEDARLMLPTPASFARIACAGLGADYDTALTLALSGSPLHATGMIARVEPAGSALPLAQHGLRLTPEHSGILFGVKAAQHAQDVETKPEIVLFPRAARTASDLLQAQSAVWIRARARRIARQFALDLAGVQGRNVQFFRWGENQTAPVSADGALTVIDLFDTVQVPSLPPDGFAVIAPFRFEHPGFAAVDAPEPGSRDLQALWSTVPLPEQDRAHLARRFHLTLPEIRAAQKEAEVIMSIRHPANGVPTPAPDADALAEAVLNDGARRMGPSVTRIQSDVTLDDLVVRPENRRQLDDAVNWHRHGARVWADMGLTRDSADARGLSLLFSGPPGGGKTFAARCLANALKLNLYRIDLSQVVSKYIGETEKALARVFDEAEAGHGVLFFDEADAIFGKRSEVKDAHDRYANIEVGFLLQRMESFDGVMILATNLRSNLDPAFLRRIRFVVEFPMPSRSERQILWDRNLPSAAWRDEALDIEELAQRFRLSGGNIRNAAVAAAHLAAADNARLGPDHLARALIRELEKSGLPRGRKDLGPFAEFVEGMQ